LLPKTKKKTTQTFETTIDVFLKLRPSSSSDILIKINAGE